MTNYLGIDFGEKRIGLACADTKTRIACPFITIANNKDFLSRIVKIIEEKQIIAIIMGLPRNLSNKETEQTKRVRNFADQLFKVTKIKVIWQDEAGTSKQVREEHRGNIAKGDIDREVAAIILQDYLNTI